MKKIKLYIATSFNGKIADKDGGVDWLHSIPNPDKTDYGYAEFYASIDTTIMGYSTYKQLVEWGIDWPYPEKKNYVLTRKSNLRKAKHVEFISEKHIDFIKNLKSESGKDIWLIGGGQVNTFLLNEGLIDDLQVFVMPVIIPEGIEIFEMIPQQTRLNLLESRSFSSGVVKLKYLIKNTDS